MELKTIPHALFSSTPFNIYLFHRVALNLVFVRKTLNRIKWLYQIKGKLYDKLYVSAFKGVSC